MDSVDRYVHIYRDINMKINIMFTDIHVYYIIFTDMDTGKNIYMNVYIYRDKDMDRGEDRHNDNCLDLDMDMIAYFHICMSMSIDTIT